MDSKKLLYDGVTPFTLKWSSIYSNLFQHLVLKSVNINMFVHTQFAKLKSERISRMKNINGVVIELVLRSMSE